MVFFRLRDRNHAAVGHFADHVLELDRGMVDAEIAEQTLFHFAQDAFADRRRNVGDRNVTGERVSLRSDAPDVKIVHVIDSADGADGGLDLLQLHAARRAFQKNVERLAHDAEAGPQDQHTDP